MIKESINSSTIIAHVIRLLPDQDLYCEIKDYLTKHKIKAAFIMSCVGSLKKIHIRTAASNEETKYIISDKFYEITSLVGCISIDRTHIHITLTQNDGVAIGGHLMSTGNIVFTTAEIVLGILPDLIFTQEYCEKSGWPELSISKLNN